MPTTYHLENAASGRAKCKKCKEKIGKGELRIATNSQKEDDDYAMTSYAHVKCWTVPTRGELKGVSAEAFVDEHLEDQTDDLILSDEAKRSEIVADVEFKPPKKAKSAGEESAVAKKIAEYKKAAEELCVESDDSEEERPAKKAKKGEGVDLEACARAMKVYGGMKADDLKDILRWNLGYGMTGVKNELLLRVIDGHVNGRLARCPQCFGGDVWLNDKDAGATVVCKGRYDEDAGVRIPCAYNAPAEKATRLQPWYSEQPTEEEMEAMKAITEKHKAMAGGGGGGDIPQELVDAAEKLEWPDTGTGPGKLAAANMLIDVCTSGKVQIDISQDEKKARIAMGKLITSNPGASAVDIVNEAFKQYGVAAAKSEAKAAQQSAIAGSCACPANAPIVAVMQELSDLYFKEGNANAGASYKKVVAALTGVEYEITADNAKGLSKAKTKVAGIGKGSSDKIHEYLTKGTIAKLEEKRAIHS